jgi:hypothetical protein
MGDFEWAIATAFNTYFESKGIAAIAYRLKQSRFASQVMDILVDSRLPEYYLAIECKSVDARKARALYFKQHFNSAGGVHQLIREDEFISRSGRTGVLAVELRRGPGKPRSAHLVPWNVVMGPFRSGDVCLTVHELQSYPALPRKGGAYQITDREIAQVFTYIPPGPADMGLDEMDSSDLELDSV